MNYQPHTYLIRFIPTGQLYYGCSYANTRYKIAHPLLLWKTYFTSSETVEKLIQEHGVNSFEVVSTKIHKDKETTLLWEHRFLTRVDAKNNPKFLNQHNGAKDFKGGPHAETTKQKMRKPKTDATKQKMRKPKSETHKQNMRKPKGAQATEHKRNISIAKTGHKRAEFTLTHRVNMSKPKTRVSRLLDRKEMPVRLFTMWVNSLPAQA
jgi:hypothetical protein